MGFPDLRRAADRQRELLDCPRRVVDQLGENIDRELASGFTRNLSASAQQDTFSHEALDPPLHRACREVHTLRKRGVGQPCILTQKIEDLPISFISGGTHPGSATQESCAEQRKTGAFRVAEKLE